MTDIDELTDVELVALDELYPYSNNAKEHPDEQIEKIASSIREYGFDQPLVTDADGEIVKGHGRYRAAQRLGLDRVPVVVNTYESDAAKKAARLADNRVAESDWDDELLSVEVEMLAESDFDESLTGFDDDEIDDLLEVQTPPELDDDELLDETPESELRVVLIAEDEADADFVGAWADEQGIEWHVVDQ